MYSFTRNDRKLENFFLYVSCYKVQISFSKHILIYSKWPKTRKLFFLCKLLQSFIFLFSNIYSFTQNDRNIETKNEIIFYFTSKLTVKSGMEFTSVSLWVTNSLKFQTLKLNFQILIRKSSWNKIFQFFLVKLSNTKLFFWRFPQLFFLKAI